MNLFNQLFKTSKTENAINNNSLFIEENPNAGKFKKATFISDLQRAALVRPSFAVHAQKLIDFMQAKRRFASAPTQTFDKGTSVTWCHVRYGNTTVRLCVPNIPGMAELIEDYEHGRIIVSQTFEDLLTEANKQNVQTV